MDGLIPELFASPPSKGTGAAQTSAQADKNENADGHSGFSAAFDKAGAKMTAKEGAPSNIVALPIPGQEVGLQELTFQVTPDLDMVTPSSELILPAVAVDPLPIAALPDGMKNVTADVIQGPETEQNVPANIQEALTFAMAPATLTADQPIVQTDVADLAGQSLLPGKPQMTHQENGPERIADLAAAPPKASVEQEGMSLTPPTPESDGNIGAHSQDGQADQSPQQRQAPPMLTQPTVAADMYTSASQTTQTAEIAEFGNGIPSESLRNIAEVRGAAQNPQTIFQPTATGAPNYIVQIAQNAPQANGDMIDIALDPPELGKVRMSVSATDVGTVIQITAERQDTLDLLRRNPDLLTAEFKAQGFADISFAFSQQDQSPSEQSLDQVPVDGEEENVTEGFTRIGSPGGTGETGLDLRI